MDSIAVKLERLKREAKKEWQRKWRQRLRQAAPANSAEWRALAGHAAIAFLKIALIIALPFAALMFVGAVLLWPRSLPLPFAKVPKPWESDRGDREV